MSLHFESDPEFTMFVLAPARIDSDERFTPRWLFDALGETFDLDPAAPVEGGDHVPAAARFTRLDDGLAQPWHGFVWLNPPFSQSTAWADRFQGHGHGLWLGPVANARWFVELSGAASRVWLMRDFAFDHPTHAGRRSSMPLGMIALGDRAAAAIDRAAKRLGPAAGTVVHPARPDSWTAEDCCPLDHCNCPVGFHDVPEHIDGRITPNEGGESVGN